jgi:NAD-dependent deacetylase
MSARSGAGAATQQLAELVRESACVVALTGAGISVPSGIPDFRSPGTGLWERVDPMEVAHIDAFRRDPVRFWGFYRQRFASLGQTRPNPAHEALVALQRAGVLRAVITQNVDMLHREAGTDELVEVHGSIATCSCPQCASRVDADRALELIAGDADGVPRCERCEAPLKPAVVLFGELLDERRLARARELCEAADVLLCIGSSLEVHPVAALPQLTLARGGRLAIITQSETPLDGLAAVRLRGDVVAELRGLLAALGLGVAQVT